MVYYYSGKGVLQDKQEAYFWGLIGAANGSEMALNTRNFMADELTEDEKFLINQRAKKWFADHE